MSFPTVLCLAIWGFASQLLTSVEGPLYPPYAQRGGTAVFAVRFNAGQTKDITPLFGEESFAASGLQALHLWKFDPGAAGEILVVICYRRPELFAVGSAAQEINLRKSVPGLPVPRVVIEPAYPADTTVQGSVVLRVEIGGDGAVGDITAIKGLGPLTEASVQAAGKWRFKPAQDQKGNAIKSDAYVVFVFRPPVLIPAQAKPE